MARAEPATTLTARAEPQIYSVRINGRPAGEAVFLRLDGERLLASEGDWQRWHLLTPPTQYVHEGQTYFALADAPGYRMQLDQGRGEALLEFAPRAFAPTRHTASGRRHVRAQPPPGLGGFLNYEFVGTQRVPDGADARSHLGGLLETGVFHPGPGVLTSQWVGRNLTEETLQGDGAATDREVVRLETALTRDFPDDMETLRIGDGVGASGLWGRPVRFGGARFTRNFGTQPGFVTLPQPAFSGETALPSVLDVYIDGLRRDSIEVPPGPFVVENIPTMTGQGEVQLVVRDLLGRETLISDSYIAGVQQLRPGLHDYSYEAGFVRERFGLESNEYGDFFAAATHRYGFADEFTGEIRAEAGSDAQTAGIGGVYAIPSFAVIANAFAVSHSDRGSGAMDVLSIQHQARRGLTAGVRLQVASRNFTQVGLPQGFSLPEHSLGANIGYQVKPLGRFGLAYVNRDEHEPRADLEAVTATFSRGFRHANVALLGVRRISPSAEYSVGLTVSVPLGTRESASAGYRHRDPETGAGSSQAFARVQRSLPEQEGWGYRVRVTEDRTDTGASTTIGEAGVGLNARYGSYALEAATTDAAETYRATVSGGLGAMAGHAFASRKLARSFAVVETGAPDVVLLVNNRVAGTTDGDGVAVLPYLQPYQSNRVRVDTTDVPLDVEVHTGEFEAAPYYRSGVLIPLDVRQTRGALVTLLKADGKPVPAGGVVAFAGDEFPVGKHGQAYVAGLQPGDNALDVRWNGQRCRLTVTLPADPGVQPKLGPYTCPP